MQRILLVGGLAMGALIAYVDSRPAWDDTGVTAAFVLLATGVLGFLGPNRAWLWALAVGLWIPAWGVVRTQNYASMLALLVAFAGSYLGAGIRTRLSPTR